MFDLAAAAARNTTVTIRLADQEVQARRLSFADERRIDELAPEPAAPLRQPPNKGSLAEPVPDTNDAGYLNALHAQRLWRRLLYLAAAIDLDSPPGPWSGVKKSPTLRKQWADHVRDTLAEQLGEEDILPAYAALWKASSLAVLAEEAAKNSSAATP